MRSSNWRWRLRRNPVTLLFTLLALAVSAEAQLFQGSDVMTVTNDGVTGTTVAQLAIVNTSGNAVNAGVGNTAVPVFIVVSGAGTTGSALLATGGTATCQTDAGGAVIGHFLVASTTTAGRCHDAGVTSPGAVFVVGQAQSTAAANANTTVVLSSGYLGSSALTGHTISLPLNCEAASASGTAYTCTTSPSFTPADGDLVNFEADVANTGSATLAVNGAAAATIKKVGGGTNLVANDILANQWTWMQFDGTNWQMLGPVGNAPGTGTVTSVSFTGGLISVATPTTTPALTVAGTSGGVPYFSGAATWASSAVMGSGQFVLGGGAGSSPTTSFSVVPLANGGTNGADAASNGGVVYSNATQYKILAGTATANQALLSGSSAAPAWSTATYPATTTINQILYSSAANTIAGLATANNAVVVTSPGGVPSVAAPTAPLAVSASALTCTTCATTTNGGALSATLPITISAAGVIAANAVTGTGNTLVEATSPSITTGINDTNGNALLAFTATASAVDGFTFTNAATANPATVQLAATGTDTNIGLSLVSKGTGGILVPTGTAAAPGLSTPSFKNAGVLIGIGAGANVGIASGGVEQWRFGANIAAELNGSSTGIITFAPTTVPGRDIAIDRDATGVLGITQGTQGTTAANYRAVKASGYIAGGTTFTLSANACSADTLLGAASRGSFISRTTGTCTVTVLMGNSLTAPNGFHCTFENHTTTANFQGQTGAADTTHCSMTGTTVTGDLISFSAEPY